ncbi:MAG: GNAT family N-acetyltransferase, partial [Candidatus Zixiibacteriota bacterium]
MSTLPSLVGEKVLLRPAVPDDINDAHHWLTQSDPDAVFPYITRLISPVEAAESFRREPKNDMDLTLTVAGKKDEATAGLVTARNYNPLNRSIEINVLIDPEKRRKGLGKDALKVLTKYLFMQRGVNKVYSQVGGFNQSGIKLFESTGFKKDGTLRNHHFYQGEF